MKLYSGEIIKNCNKVFISSFLENFIIKSESFNGKKTHDDVLEYIKKLTKKYGGKIKYVKSSSEEIPYYEYYKNEIVLIKNHYYNGKSRKDIIRQYVHELAHLIQYLYINSFYRRKDLYNYIDSSFENQLKFELTAERLAFVLYKVHFKNAGVLFKKKDFNWYKTKWEKINLFKFYPNNCDNIEKDGSCKIGKKCEKCEYCLKIINKNR